MAELLSKAWIVCKAVAVPDNSEIIFEIFYSKIYNAPSLKNFFRWILKTNSDIHIISLIMFDYRELKQLILMIFITLSCFIICVDCGWLAG